jgi:hypothetical protein
MSKIPSNFAFGGERIPRLAAQRKKPLCGKYESLIFRQFPPFSVPRSLILKNTLPMKCSPQYRNICIFVAETGGSLGPASARPSPRQKIKTNFKSG